MNRIFCTFVLFFALSVTVYATDATLNTRNLRVADIAKAEAKAKAIVAGLGQLCDSTRENVHIVIANRYLELCAIHNRYDNRNDSIRALKLPKQKEANAFERSYYNYNNDLYRTRFDFIAWLNFYLTDAQVETVKNLMTNNYLFVRYNDFIDLLPSLTEAERERVYHWLVEAREFSMDFLDDRKMRQMFTKDRGRINNYLAKRGYDLRKATEEQEARKCILK